MSREFHELPIDCIWRAGIQRLSYDIESRERQQQPLRWFTCPDASVRDSNSVAGSHALVHTPWCKHFRVAPEVLLQGSDCRLNASVTREHR